MNRIIFIAAIIVIAVNGLFGCASTPAEPPFTPSSGVIIFK